jgi:hypothetical protein
MMAHSLPAMPGGHLSLDPAQGAYLGAPMAAVQGYPVQIPPGYALVPAMPGVPQMQVRARTLGCLRACSAQQRPALAHPCMQAPRSH